MTRHRVLVVDDDFRVAGLHARFVGAAPGFEVVGLAHTASAAREAADRLRPDLVLLDVYLPDGSGLDLLPVLAADVLVVTAANDAVTVRTALRRGAVNYLVKPFGGPELTDRLRAWAAYRAHLAGDRALRQSDVDRAVRLLHEGDSVAGAVPKGRSSQTAALVVEELRDRTEPVSAAEVATALGLSRPTAHRYLADLAADGRVEVALRYGSAGRPEHRYSWRSG